ncbi:MAG TPA: hypothetical protein VIL46_07705 [Gemmataceae bacterium]
MGREAKRFLASSFALSVLLHGVLGWWLYSIDDPIEVILPALVVGVIDFLSSLPWPVLGWHPAWTLILGTFQWTAFFYPGESCLIARGRWPGEPRAQ